MTGPAGDGDAGADPAEATPPAVIETRLARRRRALGPVPGRTTVLVTAVLVVVGAGIISAAVPAPSPGPPAAAGDGALVAPTSATTSSLFCTTGAGFDAGSGATGVVVLTNLGHTAARGMMSVVQAAGGAPQRSAVTVPARGSLDVTPAAGLPAGATAATFTFAGGGVAGAMVVAGPTGWSTAPCASSVSAEWDFVGGSTSSGSLDLSLYNPTAAQAVVDATFLTASDGVLVPQAYQGMTLAPGQLTVVGLGAYVQNQPVVATLIQASSGSVVASELDRMVVPSGSGLALVSGTPAPASTWRLAQTTAVSGGTVTVAVANPGAAPLTALVTVGLSSATVTPMQLAVPGHGVATFAASGVPGWPLGSPYSLTVTAPQPVVVGRTVAAPAGPVVPQGGLTGGAVSTAPAWLVVGPGVPGTPLVPGATIQTLGVTDPGTSPVEVTVAPLTGGRPVARVRIAPGGLVVFGPAVVGGLRPLVVTATGPVGVEVDDGPTGAPGVVSAAGFPLSP